MARARSMRSIVGLVSYSIYILYTLNYNTVIVNVTLYDIHIGTMCVRTLVSILPTLSREYDCHFKPFARVPVQSPSSSARSATTTTTTAAAAAAVGGAGAGHEGEDDDDDKSTARKETNGENTTGKLDEEYSRIPFRGSRCFEVLGLDIMVDADLKPWLIEVNHLPRYSTSPYLEMLHVCVC